MKKLLVIQVALLVALPASLCYALSATDVYSKVKSVIVSVLCLSCIKMKPILAIEFSFGTANSADYPFFIIENLSKGAIMFHFRIDACKSCDKMDEELSNIFECKLEKEHYIQTKKRFQGVNVTLIHINLDHVDKETRNLYNLFNILGEKGGVPMLSIVTLGRTEKEVKPCYATLYGYQNRDTLLRFIEKGVEKYLENRQDLKGF